MKLAMLYKRVVNDGVVVHARELPMEDRAGVIKTLTARLETAGRDADKLAKQVPASAQAFREIAATSAQR